MGHLGDTIIALPALWTVRKRFPNAHIVFLSQQHNAGKNVQGLEVLREGTVYDEEMSYTLGSGGVSKLQVLKTLLRLRLKRIDTLIYIPSYRTASQLARDKRFFQLAGIKNIVGMRGYAETDYRPQGSPLPVVQHEADILLSHLAKDGVTTELDRYSLMDMGLSAEEKAFGEKFAAERGLKTGRPVVGIGPGSKMPSKLWPIERFIEVSKTLYDEFKPIFVLFGSPQEREVCQQIADHFPDAINVAGELTVRQSAAVFEHCDLYLGNDTGTMHIAVAAGVRCVALFSARDWQGRWYPYGKGHAIHRVIVPCEGCMLEVCDKQNLCLTSISSAKVAESAAAVLRERLVGTHK